MGSRCQHLPQELLLTSCLCLIYSTVSLSRLLCSFILVALAPQHPKPFLKMCFYVCDHWNANISGAIKAQPGGENACQGKYHARWLIFLLQVKTGPLNQTNPRCACSLPTHWLTFRYRPGSKLGSVFCYLLSVKQNWLVEEAAVRMTKAQQVVCYYRTFILMALTHWSKGVC